MIETIVIILLWFSPIACGLLAGLYFAFSAFIMQALGEIDRPAGIAAMNAINRVIQRSAFMPLFIGSTLSCLALPILALVQWGRAGSTAMLAGGAIYVVGMFVVTMLYNVPLNNALVRAEREGDDTPWTLYLDRWTRWNHVRTIACTATLALFIWVIAQR